MTPIEQAARQALEALNEVTGWQWAGPMRVMDEVGDAIAALREALSGVQALSAAPAGWKLVPEDATKEMVRATDKVNFANADTDGTIHNVWNVMLAASPTPPAEQQAAPKAAPGEPVNGWPVEATIYKRRDEWVLELSGTINDCEFTCRHTQPGYLQPEDVAGLPSLYSEGIAPQQEAQEPIATQWLAEMIMSDCGCSTQNQRLLDRIVERITQYDAANTAPQPAPAPLSDDDVRDAARWRMVALIGYEVMLHPEKRTQAAAVKAYMDATHSGLDLTGAVDAALAAQGGK